MSFVVHYECIGATQLLCEKDEEIVMLHVVNERKYVQVVTEVLNDGRKRARLARRAFEKANSWTGWRIRRGGSQERLVYKWKMVLK